ncbi:hypothetical protein [Candidatus Nitrosocosmicus franklandus]|uniref:Uncharacterized protein n=1 Tax=Candidatus Nitrosocosmicus franklandianus TaxID=1798806 RepID=A0A484ID10_9ARCH|nr:hypothetical protein [Candidatus Nitrosocosmicus franklandus]VFJ14696.1 protein of unknown function [Candidatus Nitrosocosmicus franklandus]
MFSFTSHSYGHFSQDSAQQVNQLSDNTSSENMQLFSSAILNTSSTNTTIDKESAKPIYEEKG